MKARNFEHTLTADFVPITGPTYFQGMQIENPAGNDVVEYRWATGPSRLVAAEEYAEWIALTKDDPIRNEIEVKGTVAQTLQGEYWVNDDQVA